MWRECWGDPRYVDGNFQPLSNSWGDLPTWLDLIQYSQLAENYSQRQLRHPEDIFNAFSGITSTLSRTFTGGFICCLLEMFFTRALLWQTSGTARRRLLREDNEVLTHLPSWSWAGWQGPVESSRVVCGGHAVEYPGEPKCWNCSVTPLCTWYCGKWLYP
jgi:hypothetical protein